MRHHRAPPPPPAGAVWGGWVFTSGALADGKVLCLLQTHQHMLGARCDPDRVDMVFLNLLREGGV